MNLKLDSLSKKLGEDNHAYRRGMVQGFTLIELLVVIAIIGILASVVLTSLSSARMKGRDGKRLADIGQIRIALELFYDNCGEYPEDIYAAISACAGGIAGASYMATMPTDPSGGTYAYANLTGAGAGCAAATEECTRYHLGASLESTSPALDTDADACAGAVGGDCKVQLAGTVVDGRDTDSCATADDNTKKCYDIVP